MTRLFSIRPAITFRGRKGKGIRGLAGKPTHPPLTDVPVAAYILTAVFDVLSRILGPTGAAPAHLYVAGSFVMLAGVIVSVPTALTGFWDWWKSTPRHTQAWRTANWHMAVMLTVTAVVVVDLLLRWGRLYAAGPSTTVLVLSVIVGGLVTYGAAYGGSLVYEHGFNVETAGDSPVWHESETDVFPGGKA
ncbi:MAG: hypothetical protein QOK14_1518 [Frankiaceae bacterium]|nr:hypothetical protein [Frankiaceae bacterium]